VRIIGSFSFAQAAYMPHKGALLLYSRAG